VAQLVPLQTSALERLVAEGRAVAPRQAFDTLPEPVAGPALGVTLAAMRDDERY